jgi:membrane protein required for colicin V production
MIEGSINTFDLAVFGILALSALLSFFRGFLRELLSLATWVGAGLITLYYFPNVAEWMKEHVQSDLIASGFASLGTFVVALIGLSIFSSILLKYMKPAGEIGSLDNILGLAFGVARGLLLVAIGYYLMTLFLKEKDYPEWIESSFSKPYVQEVAGWIGQLAPSYLAEVAPKPGALEDTLEPEERPAAEPSEDSQDWTVRPSDSNDATDEEGFWPSMNELQQTIEDEKSTSN